MIFEMLILVVTGKPHRLSYVELPASFPGKWLLIRRSAEFPGYQDFISDFGFRYHVHGDT
jgi:hypothetical protein